MNKALLIGRLGKDPEPKYLADGSMVTNFTLATGETYKDKNGEKVQKTEWHRITAWGRLAEICAEYLKKGSLVMVEGKIETRSYDDKEGIKRYQTGITAQHMEMLDKKGDNNTATEKQDDTPAGDVPF